MLTLKHVDKQAFESLLSRLKLSFEDLSRNDNRSQFPSPERNLDYRVRLPRDREALVELEGRDMPKGRLQPSKAWLKEDELESLLAWENADPRERIALVVFAFRSETPLVDHKPTMSLHGVNYLLMGCRARDYFPLRRDRCVKDGWGTCDLPNRGFLRIAARAEELLG